MARHVSAVACEPGEGLMTEVIDRLAAAMNAHDLNVVAGLIHLDYRSEQPARVQPLSMLLVNGRSSTPIQAGHNRFG